VGDDALWCILAEGLPYGCSLRPRTGEHPVNPSRFEAVLADLAARARTAGTATPLIDLAVLALRIHNRQIGS
jgi:hypothetical protein